MDGLDISVIGKIGKTLSGVEWTIENYFSLSSPDYTSPEFYYAEASWRLCIWPNCPERCKSVPVVLQLKRTTPGPSIHVEYSLSVRTRGGDKYGEVVGRHVFEGEEWIPTICILLYSRRMSELVPDGTLTVLCTLKSIQSSATDDSSTAETCLYCKITFESPEDVVSHQKKCTEKPVKCPDCGDVVILKDWYDHDCQKTTAEEEVKKTSTLDDIEDDKSEVAAEDEPEYFSFSQTDATDTKESGSLIKVFEEPSFGQFFNLLLEQGKATDVTFVLETPEDKKEFFAHRLVLATKSSYFADLLYGGKQRSKDKEIIHLENVDPEAFKDMIRYCYDWKPLLKTIDETYTLLEVASQFEVMKLVKVCQTFLRETKIETGNVFKLLVISEKMEDKSLRDKCIKFLQEKTKEVLEFYELHDVTPSMVHVILDLSKLSLCSEYELIKWIFDWAKVKYQEKDSDCENAREYLEKSLQEMNFLDLTLEEFVMLCKDNQGFFSPVEFQSICMNISSPGTVKMPDWYDKELRFRTYTGLK